MHRFASEHASMCIVIGSIVLITVARVLVPSIASLCATLSSVLSAIAQ